MQSLLITVLTCLCVSSTAADQSIEGLTDAEAAVYNPMLGSYWDLRHCGKAADNNNWEWCSKWSFQCKPSVNVHESLCVSGQATLNFTRAFAWVDGCMFAYYAQYVCQEAPEKAVNSGDTVFLKTYSGNGNHIDVEGIKVQARWQSHGTWQALTIEKKHAGTIHSGDVVYLKAHTGAHIDVDPKGKVQARWNHHGGWQAMTIQKKAGSGAIRPDDIVCFKAHTGKHIDVENDHVQARWNDCGDWQAMRIQAEAADAFFSGNSIHLLAHTGNRFEAEPQGGLVRARWSERGLWQTFTIENYAGRVIYSGDLVWLKSHNGALVHVEDTAVMANAGEYGDKQLFTIQKKSGSGAIKPDDHVCLRAYTGKFVDVEGTEVQARWPEPAAWETFVVENATSSRRLTESLQSDLVV